MLTKEKLSIYRQPSEGIIKWCNELVYFPAPNVGIVKITLWPYQEEILRKATAKINGKWKYSTICLSLPKRNSKTFLASILAAWRFTCFYNTEIVIAANSKDQASSVAFDKFKKIIENSPDLLDFVGKENILDKEVRIPHTQSRCVVLSSSKAASWGYGIDLGIVDEIHAAPDAEGLYQILASQTGERGGQVILPSQVSSKLNIFYQLYKLHQNNEDPNLFFYYLADDPQNPKPWYEYNPSPLLTEEWLNSRKAQMTQQQYDAWHRNLWVSSTKKLFSLDKIGQAVESGSHLRIPISRHDLELMERKFYTRFKIGYGLDRALPYSKQGDRTIGTVVAKGFYKDKDFYIILDQKILSDDISIKEHIKWAYNEYKYLHGIALEVYQAADIYSWLERQGLANESELIHAGDRQQIPCFTELYQIINDGRLAIPEGLPTATYGNETRVILTQELQDFEHEIAGDIPKFGHPPGSRYKDDSVYSLGWAIYSLREEDTYTVKDSFRIIQKSIERQYNRWTGA